MNDRQIIVKALKAIASAFSFCDTDMELALRDRLNTIHEAIEELANDDSTPKNDVSDDEVDANDANAASVSFSSVTETENADSRAKLEEDANAVAIDYWDKKRTWGEANDLKREIIALLDRQAAITERECLERATGERVGFDCAECAEGLGKELDARCDPLKERIAELQAKVDELETENARLRALAEHDELLYNGGAAEDWYNCLTDMTLGKELIEKSLTAENKRLRAELESARAGLKHQKAMRKKAESLVKDGQALDMAELKEERDMWRERCGRMLDAAHEIERIAEVDE